MSNISTATIENVTIATEVAPHNEHTGKAVAAIAQALEANARAAEALANALKGPSVNATGIHLHDLEAPHQ